MNAELLSPGTARLVAAAAAAVEGVLAGRERPVALHEPEFSQAEAEALADCLQSTYVSTVGPLVDAFAAALAETCGVRYAVPVNTGSAALHLCLLCAGIGPGDEVLVPALSFAATAAAVAYTGATPHFVDIGRQSLGVDPEALGEYLDTVAEATPTGCRNRRTGRRIAAVVPMHAFGHPVDMDPLTDVAARFGLAVIEDAAESLGSTYKGHPMGGFGRCAALSFNGNKIVTTGGGGAVVTNDEAVYRLARHLSSTAKRPHPYRYDHDMVGYNYRLPNLNAALGLTQLRKLPDFLARKRLLASRYAAAIDAVPGLRFAAEPAYGQSNYWLCGLLLDAPDANEAASARDALIERLRDAGILVRPAWRLLSDLPMYADAPRMALPRARWTESRLVSLPSSVRLGGPPA
ncbi:LegC family aminotransferase [Solidesulfovibrio sp.]|uniref:LegC family aminotransferase n=1 Tax=Solidesulfovibrio sp. TaxID=2910990 RepID=UPI002B1F7377|nr:LegC family aminotransferase [Solidesulfovibrio sp.]MEA5088414.1 LegC family aminotransferase [Solidesulfovibrio sp.]